jgi:UDP-GlcNAc:undecaprenyl-phosphate GlcNAc-1-phosphate transferase
MIMGRRVVGVAAGAVAARLAYRVLRATASPPSWERTNHRGHTVTLLEGPAFAAGAAAALAVAPSVPLPARAAGTVALLGAGAVGAYDDLAGAGAAKGFAGHLAALRRGEVTSGAVKMVGIGATGLASAALVARSSADVLLGGALVAGFANLVNLLDLRPGRALKFGLLHAPLLLDASAGGALLAAPLGAAAALLPEDLGERAMLGDAGANALGALLGTAVLVKYGRGVQLAHLLVIAVLTAASERVSFTRVIEATPALRWVDELGQRPGPAAG